MGWIQGCPYDYNIDLEEILMYMEVRVIVYVSYVSVTH